MAGADHPQPVHRPPAPPQGRGAGARGRSSGGSGQACIPRRGGVRILPREAPAGEVRAGQAASRAEAGPGDGLLRRPLPERDRGAGGSAAGHGQDADAARHEKAAGRPALRHPGAFVNVDLSPEDRTILAALESGGEPPVPSEADETLARLYTEVLGLVPYELEPAAPRPEVKSRLLSIIRGDETLPGDETQEMEPRLAPPAPVVPSPPLPRPAISREVPVARGMAMSARRRSVWP